MFNITNGTSNDGNFHQGTILSHKYANGLVTNYFLIFVSSVFIAWKTEKIYMYIITILTISVLTITKSKIRSIVLRETNMRQSWTKML